MKNIIKLGKAKYKTKIIATTEDPYSDNDIQEEHKENVIRNCEIINEGSFWIPRKQKR
jgi:hypothetical protein